MGEKGGGRVLQSKGNINIDPFLSVYQHAADPTKRTRQGKIGEWESTCPVLRRGLQLFTQRRGEVHTHFFNYRKQLKGKLDTPSLFSLMNAHAFVHDFFFIPFISPPTLHPFLPTCLPSSSFVSLPIWTTYWTKKLPTNKRWKKLPFVKDNRCTMQMNEMKIGRRTK